MLPLWVLTFATSAASHVAPSRQVEALSRRIAADPGNVDLVLHRADLHYDLRHWHAALEDFDRAAALAPGLAIVEYLRGRTLVAAGRAEEALVSLDRFLATTPDHVGARVERARALRALRHPLAAARELDRALPLLSGAAAPAPQLYLDRARDLLAAGIDNAAEAVAGLDEGSRRAGWLIVLETEALDIEVATGQVDAAMRRLDGILARVRRPERWLARRGEILHCAGRRADAADAYGSALAAIAALPHTRSGTAEIARLRGEVRSALAELGAIAGGGEPVPGQGRTTHGELDR